MSEHAATCRSDYYADTGRRQDPHSRIVRCERPPHGRDVDHAELIHGEVAVEWPWAPELSTTQLADTPLPAFDWESSHLQRCWIVPLTSSSRSAYVSSMPDTDGSPCVKVTGHYSYSPDDAEQVARALLAAAKDARERFGEATDA